MGTLTLADLTDCVAEFDDFSRVHSHHDLGRLGVIMHAPISVVFGRSAITGLPILTILNRGEGWRPYLDFMLAQFPSLTEVPTNRGCYKMSSHDYAKMRLIFGGAEWAP